MVHTGPFPGCKRWEDEIDTAVELAGARAAVLARLWGALVREPVEGVVSRQRFGGDILLGFAGGQRVIGSAAMAEPFASPPDDLRLTTDSGRVDDPVALLEILRLPGESARLLRELEQSVELLALARAGRQKPLDNGELTLNRLAGRRDGLALLEQAVVDGHPLHPCCRTRLGMSEAEVLAYAPEHRNRVELELFEVPRRRWLTTGAGLPPTLPVHPWQREHVLGGYPFLRATRGRIPAWPLMSLRTLASVADPSRHYKTAVDVQMTSAVRIVSPAAVRNGPLLSAMLISLSADMGLEIWPEPAAGTVLGDDGEPVRHLAVSTRKATLPGHDEVIMPLAALAAPSPADGRPLIREAVTLGYGGHPAGFLADLTGLLLAPLLTLLHRGVALEAHGQNVLVTLQHGRPVRLSYRDVGGVRVSPERLRRHHFDPPRLFGDVVTDDPAELRNKALASGITLALGEPIAVLSREYDLDPLQLWRIVRERAEAIFVHLPPTSGGDAKALLHDPLPVKATTAMRLAAQPLQDIWATIDNPLPLAT
ncbi:MAG TPA: IucA/IucC family protein [Candidatus Limnocylindrales bacterium]